MSISNPRPGKGAAVTLAHEPGKPADPKRLHEGLRLAELALRRATVAVLEAQRLATIMVRGDAP